MDYPLHNVIGNLGVIMIVGSYFLVQIGKMSATGFSYTSLNGVGAAFIMVSLYFDFNLSAFIIEVFWILISLVGMVRIYLERRRKAVP
jgi:multidrug transporter EmrE-like cation transporter